MTAGSSDRLVHGPNVRKKLKLSGHHDNSRITPGESYWNPHKATIKLPLVDKAGVVFRPVHVAPPPERKLELTAITHDAPWLLTGVVATVRHHSPKRKKAGCPIRARLSAPPLLSVARKQGWEL